MGGWSEKFHYDKEIKGLQIGLEACGDEDGRKYIRGMIREKMKEIEKKKELKIKLIM